MANPVAGAALLRLNDGLGDQRQWQASFTATPTAAGTTITVTVSSSTAGASPPGAEDTLSLEILGDTGSGVSVLRTITLTPAAASQSATFTLTDTAAAGGSARCGTYQVRIHAVRTSGISTSNYSAYSDGTGTAPSGFSIGAFNNGYILSQTTLTIGLEPSAGGVKPAIFGYGDAFWARVTLGAPPVVSGPTVTVTLNGLNVVASMVAGTGTYDVQWSGVVDNRFAASSGSFPTTTAYSNANGAGIGAWLSPSSTTQDSGTFDPRFTKVGLLQVNDNAWGTAPLSKDVPLHQRLTADLGFLAMRYRNANGVGVNVLSVSHTLQDSKALTTAVTWTDTTATEGGEAGWTNTLQPWTAALPGGTWTHTTTVTAPTSATGLESGSDSLVLLARNPNYQVIAGLSLASGGNEGSHLVAGENVVASLIVLNVATDKSVPIDTGSAVCSVLRRNPTTAVLEALQADGTTWATWGVGDTLPVLAMSTNPSNANLYERTLATASWSTTDIIAAQVQCKVNGTPYAAEAPREITSALNRHDKYAFDGPGFVGFPTR